MKKYSIIIAGFLGAVIGTLLALLYDFSVVIGFSAGTSLGLIVGAIVALIVMGAENERNAKK